MKIIEGIDIGVVQQHEKDTKANATLGGYNMDKYCPPNAFKAFSVNLEVDDIDRLFLLGEFARHTKYQTCKVEDVLPEAASFPRVASFIRSKVDLCSSANLAIVIVSADARRRPLIIIDGNHRAIAHYLTYRSVHDVRAYVCVHNRISEWPYVPQSARG